MPRLLTLAETADLLRVNPQTVRRYAIPYVRFGKRRLYDEAAVQAFIQEHVHGAPGGGA